MKIETFNDSMENANTYLVSSEKNCIIIDPANQYQFIKKRIGNKKVLAILLTHGHYDHFKELPKILKQEQVKCYLHKKAILKLDNINSSCSRFFGITELPKIETTNLVTISDGETLVFDDIKVKVMFTPGHTDCSVSYVIEDSIFTGDTLFKNSVGRTDLPTGSMIVQKETLMNLKKIKKDFIIYPGHDESTVLSVEIKNNPYMK